MKNTCTCTRIIRIDNLWITILVIVDYNRVVLKPINEIQGSNFINASYIQQPNGRKKYIAAQGNIIIKYYFNWK